MDKFKVGDKVRLKDCFTYALFNKYQHFLLQTIFSSTIIKCKTCGEKVSFPKSQSYKKFCTFEHALAWEIAFSDTKKGKLKLQKWIRSRQKNKEID